MIAFPSTQISTDGERRIADPSENVVRAVARELFALPRYAERPGLHRMERLLPPGRLGLEGIKITGSNGKGSVAHGVAGALRRMGLRVGLYTSPHLRSFTERFRIDGEPVASEELVAAMDRLRPRLSSLRNDPRGGPPRGGDPRGGPPPLAFEAMTALAFEIFRRAAVDVVVAEAGMGGRHDPVRRLPGSVSVLVSVDLEHTAILGETLEDIALDKADIAGDGTLLLTGELSPEILAALCRASTRRGVEVVPVPPSREGAEAPHRAQNRALAAEAALRWVARHRPEIPEAVRVSAIRGMTAEASPPCRLEKVAEDPETWVDVAHTPAALGAVAAAMGRLSPERPLTVVLGISVDKEARAREMVRPLLDLQPRFVCTRARHRGGEVEALAQAVEEFGRRARRFERLAEALAFGRSAAGDENGRLLVTGGLFVAVEAAELLAGRDPADLYFY